ncbi:MAG: GNAT family N-acetyltransferase [Dehalococcoidia bacterium]
MSVDIRPITDDEVERAEFIINYSFNNAERSDLARAVERTRQLIPNEWTLASFEDGEMTAYIRTVPFAMRINGRALSFGGVGPVVTSPEHRRKGHVGLLLRRAIEDMRERGQSISGLGTPHPALYRRYGWEIAATFRLYSFAPKDVTLIAQPSERGRFRILSLDDWSQADRVYRQWGAKRNGPLHRGQVWWQQAIFSGSQPTPADVALWEDGTGEPQGYVVYYQPTGSDVSPETGNFWVRELVALTADAYLNLVLYLCRHDLPEKIVWTAPMDDPLYSVVSDTYKVDARVRYSTLLRICDVQAALTQRAPARDELDCALTLRLTDSTAPWNEGTWRVELSGGEMHVEASTDEPDLSMSTTALVPIFNGYLSATASALAGLITARNEEALATADEMFATLSPPYNADPF